MIVGIYGKKRHGKDTIGQYLQEHHGYTRTALADPLKRTLMDVYGLSYNQCYGDCKEVVDPRWNMSPRQLLQKFGTEVGRQVHPQTWIRATQETIRQGNAGREVSILDTSAQRFVRRVLGPQPKWVITDVRFDDEAEMILEMGGIIVEVYRPSMVSHDTHASEQGLQRVTPTYRVINDSTPQDLFDKIEAQLPAWEG